MNRSTITMIEQKDNYIPACDSLRYYGSTRLTAGGSPLVSSRSVSEGDEDVLASIARRHVSSLGIRQAVSLVEPPVVSPVEPPVVSPVEPPVVSPAEATVTDSTDSRETSPRDVFYVRRAICKSQVEPEPARGEPVGGRFFRGRLARVLVVYLISIAVLTVTLCFMTWLDERRNEEFAQTSVLVDGGRDSPKTEDPEAETPGRRNTVIVVDR